jgi:hypothetical protein
MEGNQIAIHSDRCNPSAGCAHSGKQKSLARPTCKLARILAAIADLNSCNPDEIPFLANFFQTRVFA